MLRHRCLVPALLVPVLVLAGARSVHAWEPSKPIEFVIPAGTGGGADQMARLIAGIVDKHKLSPRPLIIINKPGGAGAEGFLHVKGKPGDAHTIIITLSNLFTTPLAQQIPLTGRSSRRSPGWRWTSSSCGSTPRRRTRPPRSTWPPSRSEAARPRR